MIEITDRELGQRLRALAPASVDLDWDDVLRRVSEPAIALSPGRMLAARGRPAVSHAGARPGGQRPRLRSKSALRSRRLELAVARIGSFERELELESDWELRERYDRLRERAVRNASLKDLMFECFGVTREAAKRTLGQRHFDAQLIGGVVLHEGSIAEMGPGEGKTLTVTLPICLNALAARGRDGAPLQGGGVHAVTANDYLARRDALWMEPIYDLLGVTVGILQSDARDPDEKQAAYAADVTYGTSSEFGLDYLRDNMVSELSERSQRGHGFAIVDDADVVLLDEARTPLVISGRAERATELFYKFAKLARTLKPGRPPEGHRSKATADFDFEPDEKHKTVAPTERGVEKAERFLGIDNLYRAENGHLVNHLQQALKAESLYKRGVDYEVIDGEVKIIDEFTGRILDGRRWSEGLHQAVEAKEGVAIQEENQTVATITYQNYFRRYDKLAGMTGTAVTEVTEFMRIYELQVVEIPPNRPATRVDRNDKIYKTKDGKWVAVAREIERRHRSGQPVLVGTTSLETSERLSHELRRSATDHTVLTGRQEHAGREGEIIAEAGRPGAVTIATNMAGRGVHIALGGNPEHLTEQQLERDRQLVKEVGGLFVLGTERHESRRIDNQLRGRSGRQGDPGESRFYLSAEDDLVRVFAGDRIYRILDKIGSVGEAGEEQPIEAKMLSEQIENAQKKVEEQNFLIRKRVLEYDDVMNQQRETIYEYRDKILRGEDMSETVREQLADVVERIASDYLEGAVPENWDLHGLYTRLEQMYPVGIDLGQVDVQNVSREELITDLRPDIVEAYEDREQKLGSERMRALERFMLLQIVDERWREHLHDMDYLCEGIHLRSFAQIDPLVAYKNEGSEMFTSLMNSFWEEFARYIYVVEVEDAT